MTEVLIQDVCLSIAMIGAFLWFHEQSDALAFGVAWTLATVSFGRSIAKQEWRLLGVSRVQKVATCKSRVAWIFAPSFAPLR
jgi:hypothetical protein